LKLKFSELQLEPSLQTAIDKLGYSEATPIQIATMPYILEGKDISGLAQTGTGKTAAFVLPIMDRILKARLSTENLTDDQKALLQKRSFADWRAQNFVLILVPTRELAEQVYDNIIKLGESSGLRGASVYGGTGYDKQKEAFKNQVEFVVATPGRLIDLYKDHVVDLKQVRAIIFDEADRMFDMGFKDDMSFILSRVPRERQFLVFSATLNFDVLNTAYQFGAEPIEIDVSRDQTKAENVKDSIYHVGHEDKPMYLLSLLKKHNPKQAIIFSNFKFNVERLAQFLSENGIPAMGISSLLTQAQRNRVMEQFKAENEKNILVATDVAARGLDIKGVDMVINYELPQDAESYVHRIGRTGRAGAEGQAFSLVCDRDVDSLSRVEDYLKHKLSIEWMEDTEFVRDFRPLPRENQGRSERPFDRQGPPQNRDRGPRRGGPREGGRDGGGRDNRNQRNARDTRDTRDRRDQRGPRPDNRNENRPAEARGENRPQRPQGNGQASANSKGPRQDNRKDFRGNKPIPQRNGKAPSPTANGQPRRGSRRRDSQNRPIQRAATPPPTIAKKVSGFFKKIFGG
jgi:superfamily II DNA/RNA helicase